MKSSVREFIGQYLPELLEGNAAVFVGAGFSAPAGFVDWRGLMRPLSSELGLDVDLEHDLVALAQFHVNANGQNRHGLHTQLINALGGSKTPTRNHELLAMLPLRTYWTTNYDKLLEDALRAKDKVVDAKSAVPQLATTRSGRDATIFKMHGDIDRPDEAVVTKDDYEKYGRTRGAFITALSGDLVSKTFLFLGFSFADPNLQHVLAELRLNFTSNQRRHFAIFRTRTKLENESDTDFDHFKVRQALVIEDLKRFNVKVILIDGFDEITEMLEELVNQYKRRTVFISTSAADFEPWGKNQVHQFAQALGEKLVAGGSRVATGLGAGVGDAVFTGALRQVMKVRGNSIEDAIVPRPFPQSGADGELKTMWEAYRQEIISQSGIALFLFGNKEEGEELVLADGMLREAEIAREQRIALLPIGSTGSAARAIATEAFARPDQYLYSLNPEAREILAGLMKDVSDLRELIQPILSLVRGLQDRS